MGLYRSMLFAPGNHARKVEKSLTLDADDRGQDAPLVIGVLADARGETDELAAVRAGFARHGVHLVVSLGGIGQSSAEVEPALAALTGPWLLLAMPGDREDLREHRAAVAALAERGVVDGSRVRQVQAAGVALFTWPGAPHREQLMAGVRGCGFQPADIDGLVTLARDAEAPRRVLLSHAPPRQAGPDASDRTEAGVHIGDPAVAQLVADAGMALVVHGLIWPAGHPVKTGQQTLSIATPRVLSAGAADGIPNMTRASHVAPLAMVIQFQGTDVSWTYLPE